MCIRKKELIIIIFLTTQKTSKKKTLVSYTMKRFAIFYVPGIPPAPDLDWT
jgi:hypothetical protein